MLDNHITDEMLETGNYRFLKENLALHIMGHNTSYELIDICRRNGIEFGQGARKQLMDDGDTMIALKFGLYKAITAPSKSESHKKAIALKNGLSEQDFDLLDPALYPKLHKHLRYLKSHYACLSYTRFQEFFDKAARESKDNVRGFILTKLIFLKNYGLTLEDIEAEIATKVYRSLLVTYPKFDDYKHFLNAYRRYSRQSGLRMISESTNQSNNVFSENGSLLKFSLDYSFEDDDKQALDRAWGNVHSPDQADQEVYLKEFLASLTPNQVRLMELLSGVNSKYFEQTLYRQSRNVHKQYTDGDRSRDVVMAIINYLSIPYSDYSALVRLSKGLQPADKSYCAIARC